MSNSPATTTAAAGSRLDGARMVLRLLGGHQVQPDVETPHTVLHTGEHRMLRRYGDLEDRRAARAAGRPPVLLVPPLAVPARCYDLGPGQSVVAELLAAGRVPYVVDFGDVDRSDRHLGFADYFDDIVPEAVGRVLADHAGADRDGSGSVDVVAWSLGGTVALLTAAAHPDLPIRSITAIGTPLDYDAVQPYPLVKKLMAPTGGKLVTGALHVLAGIPAPLVRIAYRGTAWQRELKKPAYIARNAGDVEALGRMQVIDRFQNSMPGYPGKVSLQMWENFVYRGELATGVVDFDGRCVDLTSIALPVQLFGSHRDAITSWAAARHGVDILADAEVHFTTVETSHLGLIAGDVASAETWPRVETFLGDLDAR
ncbi:alpha/beta hydrolase [Gordonia desulfuricans]|uniref:Alpha/beta hydrolase n=1 Tax=Gordonia desulfuricans TaxID=89051 RepID=A0A7K3LJV3_9ACTN|nr:alpha/beta fold hydrolase [Gordonia desulfuricans]NDK88542.1 alpha/beta hydrolase [Gordonia desulfuricans]